MSIWQFRAVLVLSLLGSGIAAGAREAIVPPSVYPPRHNQPALQKPAAESENYFKKWMDEDVAYIITAEEQDVFLKLKTPEEKETFIEQFWARRDPNPGTRVNEFKEEHYRRIQYVNERFHAGIAGWRTDRGRIFIVYGPPDRMEIHPVGGQYLRPHQEGGGQTSTYPFERWEYRHIDGVGEDVELEFVDVSGGNLFKLSSNPFEKDEFLHVPGMGLTDRERMPGSEDPEDLRRSRVLGLRDAGSARRMGIYGEMAKYHPFARTELVANLTKPPVIRFKDLQEAVTARVSYNAIPIDVSYHCVRLSDSKVLLPLTMVVPNRLLTFEESGGTSTNRLQVYGRVTSLNRKIVYEFDDEAVVSYPAGAGRTGQPLQEGQTLYRRPLALDPGMYKLETLVREVSSGRLGAAERSIQVPNLAKGQVLRMSPIVLARELERLRPEALAGQDYLLGQFKIRPNTQAVYGRDDYLAIYLEVYDYVIDPTSNKELLALEYAIAPAAGSKPPVFRDMTRGVLVQGDRILAPRQISLSAFGAGAYEIRIRVTDKLSGQVATQSASFQIQ